MDADLRMALAGVGIGLAGGWRLARRGKIWRTLLLLAGPLAAFGFWAWMKHGIPPPAVLAVFAGLFAFVMACDAACPSGRPRRLFLVLCLLLGTASVMQVYGHVVAARDLAAMGESAVSEGVYLQQTGYTCLPCSAATCLARLGRPAEERELALESGTTGLGTGDGRMVPVLRRRLEGTGWIPVLGKRTWDSLPRDGSPAVLDVRCGSIPHAVAFLGFEGDEAVLGDPLSGREAYSRQRLEAIWSGQGIFFERDGGHP